MAEVLVFAGTTEGYEIARFLSENGISVYACTATDYGKKSLEEGPCLKVHSERLDPEGMKALMQEITPSLVIDATHPYAAEVTGNIRKACEELKKPYQRVLRESGKTSARAVYVASTAAAIDYLKNTKGRVFLTTGSKELAKYTEIPDYKDRLYARVLSLPSVIDQCRANGFEGRHLIAMQGPFSYEMNRLMLKELGISYLVTKDTGDAGGFQAKIDAALDLGVVPLVIGRPLAEEGLSLAETKKMLIQNYGLVPKQQIALLGIGMGTMDTMTEEGKKAAQEADLIIGARRMADAIAAKCPLVFYEYQSEKIAAIIKEHPECRRVVIALSGDVGFYSGAKKLLEACRDFDQDQITLIPGISSPIYFCAKLGLSWDDAKIVSAHGRQCNLLSMIAHNKKTFSILGTRDGAGNLAKKLVDYGLGDVILHIGERLSYEDEVIISDKAENLTAYLGDPLSVVCAVNEKARPLPATHGLSDELFIRGKAPMTKEEVRTVSLMKMRLEEDSICYDVGAGTGSCSIEMALRAVNGKVYAIEKKEDALDLIAQNKKKFLVDNLEIVAGTAPEALEDLPAPTHAFIGGSSGNMEEIVALLIEKNRNCRIVINCITLETVTEALSVIKKYGFKDTDIVSLSAARSRSIGRYHMMMGENPIYIISCQNPEESL